MRDEPEHGKNQRVRGRTGKSYAPEVASLIGATMSSPVTLVKHALLLIVAVHETADQLITQQ